MVFEPRSADSLSSNLKEIHTSSDTTIAKSTRLPLLSYFQLEGYLPGRDRSAASLNMIQLPLVEVKFWASMAEWVPFIFPASTPGMEALPWWCTTESLSPARLALAPGVGVSILREAN